MIMDPKDDQQSQGNNQATGNATKESSSTTPCGNPSTIADHSNMKTSAENDAQTKVLKHNNVVKDCEGSQIGVVDTDNKSKTLVVTAGNQCERSKNCKIGCVTSKST